MATAKRAGGLYYTPQGAAVDANGDAVKDAPQRPADTDPSKQPGAIGALTKDEQLAVAVAAAIHGKPLPSQVAAKEAAKVADTLQPPAPTKKASSKKSKGK